MTITIWHNPRCAKSRQTLEMLRCRGIEPDVVEYLKTPPDKSEITRVIELLGVSARELMRKGEATYRENNLDDVQSEAELVEAMFHNPILIERPVVINGEAAVIGRPPQNVLKLV